MAERRMFSKTIIDSDAFLDMPLSSQALYFHLNMRGDDQGFINNPKKIMRMISANQNDFELLIAKRYILTFKSGVIVIKHWKLHNALRKDRIKSTLYVEELSQIEEKENGAYTERETQFKQVESDIFPDVNQMSADGCQDAAECPPSIGKVSIGKVSIGERRTRERAKDSSPSSLPFGSYEPKKKNPLSDRITKAVEYWNTKNLTRCRDTVLTMKYIHDIAYVFDKYDDEEIRDGIDNLEKYHERDGNVSTVFSNFFKSSFTRFSPDVVGLERRYETSEEKKAREDREYFEKVESLRRSREGETAVEKSENESEEVVPY